jgi:hypothetical protein
MLAMQYLAAGFANLIQSLVLLGLLAGLGDGNKRLSDGTGKRSIECVSVL